MMGGDPEAIICHHITEATLDRLVLYDLSGAGEVTLTRLP
jgi:hypothetical protein